MSNKQKQTNNSDHKKKEEFDKFTEFIALPRELREKQFGYKDQKYFAMDYEVNEATLSEWKQEEEFRNKVNKKRNSWTKDRTPNVLMSLYKKIMKDPRAAEIRLWMEIVEDQEQQKDEPTGLSLTEIIRKAREQED